MQAVCAIAELPQLDCWCSWWYVTCWVGTFTCSSAAQTSSTLAALHVEDCCWAAVAWWPHQHAWPGHAPSTHLCKHHRAVGLSQGSDHPTRGLGIHPICWAMLRSHGWATIGTILGAERDLRVERLARCNYCRRSSGQGPKV